MKPTVEGSAAMIPSTSTSLHIPDVHGPFIAAAYARFDNLGEGGMWQRIFDLGSGSYGYNIVLSQSYDSNNMVLTVFQDGGESRKDLVAENAIVEGETAYWTTGVDKTGRAWINKDGTLLAEMNIGFVPADVERTQKLIGLSNFGSTEALRGEVFDFALTNLPTDPCDVPLEACYLYNKSTKEETMLSGEEYYCPADSTDGWSIRCDTKTESTDDISSIKFWYDNEVYESSGEGQFFMSGTGAPTNKCRAYSVNSVEYLDDQGDKQISVEVMNDKKVCLQSSYVLVESCGEENKQSGSVRSTEVDPTDIPPQMTMCSRYIWMMFYEPSAPVGWKVEGVNPSGQRIIKDVHHWEGKIPLSDTDQDFWKAFSTKVVSNHKTLLRFVNDKGVAGPWHICQRNSPIGLDIDGSGAVETIGGTYDIDITGDGDIETLNEWFAPTEGILIDVTHGIEGGFITGHHMFGDMGGTYSDGFAKLMHHDDDKDGFVSGAELEGFAIWTDANSNAKLDEGELSTLDSHDIVSLSTSHDMMVSSAGLSDGSEMYMEDLWFAR